MAVSSQLHEFSGPVLQFRNQNFTKNAEHRSALQDGTACSLQSFETLLFQAYGYPFLDREGSEKFLTDLEEKIRAWHAAGWDRTSRASKPIAVHMKRVTTEVKLSRPDKTTQDKRSVTM